MKTLLHPLNVGVAFITFGIVLLTLSELVIDKPMFSYPLLGFTGILSIAFGLVFFGGRALRFYGFTKLRLILPIFGVLLFVAASWGSFVGNNVVKGLLELIVINENYANLAGMNDISPERREVLSKMYAQQYFIEHEKSIEYDLKDGSKKMYMPTEVDNDIVKQKKQMIILSQSLLVFAYVCIIGLILSLLSAFFSPIEKKLD